MTHFRIPEPEKVPEEFWKSCEACWGEGRRKVLFDITVCPNCGGKGKVPDEAKIRAALDGPCKRCKGTGVGSTGYPDYSACDCEVCHGSGHPEILGVERI